MRRQAAQLGFQAQTDHGGGVHVIGERPRVMRRPRGRSEVSTHARFDVAALALPTTRSQFYTPISGRTPNAMPDATRREYSPSDLDASGLHDLDLAVERSISRCLDERSPIYQGIIGTWAAEVVQEGFRAHVTDTASRSKKPRRARLVSEALFGVGGSGGWFDECCARGMFGGWDLITCLEETSLRDGDAFLYFDADGNEGRGTVAIIEGDRVVTPFGNRDPAGTRTVNGIRLDRNGRPVAVYITDEPTNNGFARSSDGDWFPVWNPREPGASGVVLAVLPRRYTFSRRLPWLSASVRTHDEISDAVVATRIAIRNQACYSTVTEIADWEAFSEWYGALMPSAEAVAASELLDHTPGPGDHHTTNPGETVKALQSTAPGANVESFIRSNERQIGLPIGMCMEETLRVFDRNFSASRLAIGGTLRRYRIRQGQLSRQTLRPVFAFGRARLAAVGDLVDSAAVVVSFAGRGRDYFDPQKDAAALVQLRDAGVISTREVCEAGSRDYDVQQEQRAAEGLPTAAEITAPTASAPTETSDDE